MNARALILAAVAGSALASSALATITTTPTTDPAALATGLHPFGLTIDSIIIKSGAPGQIGTFEGFATPPVTIRDGIVLSSGNIADLSPLAESQLPDYDPASPPSRVSSQMVPEPAAGGTPEFDAYGAGAGNIENFNASYDVAAVEVHFTLDESSQVKFDFIFASVEFPHWTSQFTDSFLVFLDGTDPNNQVTFDDGGNAVQVGSSFAGFETTADANTAFANPHGLIHHLTTTTAELDAGEHVLIFEVGDVNDHILDSVAFITGLRAQAGTEGTESSEDCPADFNEDYAVTVQDIYDYLFDWSSQVSGGEDVIDSADFNGQNGVTVQDIYDFLAAWAAGCPNS